MSHSSVWGSGMTLVQLSVVNESVLQVHWQLGDKQLCEFV